MPKTVENILPPTSTSSWWGEVHIPVDRGVRWTIGPCTFLAQRRRREWLLAKHTEGDVLKAGFNKDVDVDVDVMAEDGKPHTEIMRFAFDEAPPLLHLLPALADRPVVADLMVPFMVLPQQTVHFFLTTPLWSQFLVRPEGSDVEDATLLSEIPITRPSDTWAGESTITGTLAYASQTAARMHLEDVLRLPQRAFTRVMVRNRSNEGIRLERLQLPMENLSLFVDDQDVFWTSRYSLQYSNSTSGPTVKIYEPNDAEKKHDDKLQKVASARRPVSGIQTLLKLLSFMD
ncbi:MAG: hypothetical protein GY822_13640 [Deltaproteobacteria bacterium]|nr:hypothetical protein [Deltaproteobacteria bacterium]